MIAAEKARLFCDVVGASNSRAGGKHAAGPVVQVGIKSASTVVPSSCANRKASARVGSYLLFSMALTVWRVTPQRLASSSWESPSSFLRARMVFSISITKLSAVIEQMQQINHRDDG